MSQDWIRSLRTDYDAMHPSKPSDSATQVRDAFVRIRAEIHIVVEKLNSEFPHGFSVEDLQDGSLLITARAVPGPWTGARCWFDENAATITTDPAANFSSIPGDHHVFNFDVHSGSFIENDEAVTENELVRRALEQFLKSALGLRESQA